jgi:hypothetical protein
MRLLRRIAEATEHSLTSGHISERRQNRSCLPRVLSYPQDTFDTLQSVARLSRKRITHAEPSRQFTKSLCSRAGRGNFLAVASAAFSNRRGLRFLWSSFARRFDSAMVRRAARSMLSVRCAACDSWQFGANRAQRGLKPAFWSSNIAPSCSSGSL